MFKSILVPLDGSTFASKAVPFASNLAGAANGRVTLIRAVSEGSLIPTDPSGLENISADTVSAMENAKIDEAISALDPVARELTEHGLDVEEIVYGTFDHAASAILSEATARGADLIVMSTHGKSGIARILYGSVAGEIISSTHIPVLLVPPHNQANWAAKPGQTHQVVVALDGSPFAEEALEPASELARMLDAHLVLVQAVEPILQLGGEGIPLVDLDTSADQIAARAYLTRIAARLEGRGQGVTIDVEEGHVAMTVATIANRHHADAIVLATHGRGGFSRAILGSVANALVGIAPMPLLMVRPASIRAARTEGAAGSAPQEAPVATIGPSR